MPRTRRTALGLAAVLLTLATAVALLGPSPAGPRAARLTASTVPAPTPSSQNCGVVPRCSPAPAPAPGPRPGPVLVAALPLLALTVLPALRRRTAASAPPVPGPTGPGVFRPPRPLLLPA